MSDFEVVIEKLVHGGQGMGTLEDGRKAFVWNALPGEKVAGRFTKRKKDYVEGIAEEILTASPERTAPEEDMYLATSPWQIMSFDLENQAKADIVREIYTREHVALPKFAVIADAVQYQYRNKMEYSFWGDEDGIHLALYNRGSHQKQKVTGSRLALPALDAAAGDIIKILNTLDIRAGDLKSLMVRCTREGQTVVGLFVKPTSFPEFSLPKSVQGLQVYHSNPKSPASVATKLIYEAGNTALTDTLLGVALEYGVTGFFQVNLGVFERALSTIKSFVRGTAWKKVVDLYSGVGTIGLSVGASVLVDFDAANTAMAKKNIGTKPIKVVQASSEQALDYITPDSCVIVDPPRSGLHKDVIAKILEAGPQSICYLSCNPATQARDLGMLQDEYAIVEFEVYNFFPRTPHIETLAILERI